MSSKIGSGQVVESDWQVKARKSGTLCPCCAYRTRPACRGVTGGTLEHSWTVTHGWRWVYVRCWHCDYKCKVGSRRKIKTVEAGLAAHHYQAAIHRQMLEATAVYEKQLEADREFEEYRSQLLKRYGG